MVIARISVCLLSIENNIYLSTFSIHFSRGLPILIGYARVSTDDQTLDLQRDALKAEGCERIFEDKASGAGDRPGLRDALDHLRAGDSLVVWRLDRLGRSLKDLIAARGSATYTGCWSAEPQGSHRYGLKYWAVGLSHLRSPGGIRACPDSRAYECWPQSGSGDWVVDRRSSTPSAGHTS